MAACVSDCNGDFNIPGGVLLLVVEELFQAMTTLMCKNTPIYDITNHETFDKNLCPINFNTKAKYSGWHKRRHFIKSNRAAEATTVMSDNMDKKIAKRRLSLNDCYWIRYSYDSGRLFEEVSPYSRPYIDYNLSWGIQGSAVPDATIGGSFPKIWTTVNGVSAINKVVFDNMTRNEMAALALANKLGVAANRAWANVNGFLVSSDEFHHEQMTHGNAIFIENMTDTSKMLLPISWSTPSNIKVSRGHDVMKMRLAFREFLDDDSAIEFIVRTILFDAIVANDDRRTNMSNWGYFKCPDSGECSPAPLYDFNLAHLNQNTIYLNRIIESIKSQSMYVKIARGYLESWEGGVKDFGAVKWIENWEGLINGLCKR
jgi:hypothetical protein